MITNLPNLLTLSRIAVIPVLVALFYWDGPLSSWISLGLFIAAAVTDFFDGYFARSLGQQSRLGKIFDPIADKLLVVSVVLMLVAFQQAPVLAALVILCRELLVSGLREFLAEIRVHMPVSPLAKWKTFVQMFAIGFLLIGNDGPIFFHPAVTTPVIGEILIWCAAVLTLMTGYDYLCAGWRHARGSAADR